MDNGNKHKTNKLIQIARPLAEQLTHVDEFNLRNEDRQVIDKLVDIPVSEVCADLFQEEMMDQSLDSKNAAFEVLESVTTAMDNLAKVLNNKQVESDGPANVKNCVVSVLYALYDALTLSENLKRENADALFEKCLSHLASLEDSISHHEAFGDFKDFLRNLANCFSAMKCKIPYLQGGSRKNAVQLYILQIKMCLPLFLQILKAKQAKRDRSANQHSSESERYVLLRIDRCLSELRASLESGEGSEEGGVGDRNAKGHHHRELVETACGQFVELVDEALSLLAAPMCSDAVGGRTLEASSRGGEIPQAFPEEESGLTGLELVDVLSPKVEKILCLSMSVSHVAVSTKDAEAIVSCGQEVLRELQSLKGALDVSDEKFYEINVHASNLSESLFCLEQRVNTALLRLVVEVFGDPFASLLQLIESSCRSEGPRETRCPEDLEDLIATYDLHMDRMVQIGMFAISCSNDRKRIPRVRSCLASLESLEPELVPTAVSLYLNPSSASKASHLRFLAAHWRQEVRQLQYLLDGIVDPVAFCRVTYDEVRKLIVSLRKFKAKLESEDEASLVARLISRAQRTLRVLHQEGSDFLKKQSILISDLEFSIAECRAAHKIAFHESSVSKTEEENQKNRERVYQRCLLIASMIRKLEALMSEQSAVLSVCSLRRLDRSVRPDGNEERSAYRIGERSALLPNFIGEGGGGMEEPTGK